MRKVSEVIEIAKKKTQKIITEYLHKEQTLTMYEFEKQYNNVLFGQTSFYSFVDELVKTSNKDKRTIEYYISNTNKLKTFRKELSFADITIEFVESYKKYLLTDYKNPQTGKTNSLVTSERVVRFIKSMINEAYNRGVIPDNKICDKLESKNVTVEHEYLVVEELKKLEDLYYTSNLKDNEKRNLRGFLFGCYTGLRKGDIIDLKYSHIKQIDNETYIDKLMKKGETKKRLIIPLSNKAIKLLNSGLPNENVFNIYAGSGNLSKILNQLLIKAGVPKTVSLHTSRRTHATINSILGVNDFTNQKLMVHSKVTTTQLYTNIVDKQKIEAVKMWDSF